MLPSYIIFLAIPVILAGYFFYFKDIFYGQTRPNIVSWFLWMLGPLIGVFFQLKAGAGLSVIPVFSAGFGPFVVVVVLFFKRNFIWKITTFDVICGIFSILALVLYALTHNLAISVLFAILSDLFAFIPTYIKGWKFPETETGILYFASAFNNILALLIIKNWIFPIYSFSVYLLLANLVFLIILYRKRVFSKNIDN